MSVDWRQTSERLVRFARQRLQRRGIFDEELAQDLAGEALVRYFDPRYASFDSERHESVAYFLGSTVNGLLRNYFMKAARRCESFTEDLPAHVQEHGVPEKQHERIEAQETLVRLRSTLEGDVEVLEIFDMKLEGITTPREQVEVSNLTLGQIYAANRRAVRRFRNEGVLQASDANSAKDKAMSTAPPVTELLDVCSRWGLDGAAEEYGVTTAQVCAWMREHPEELPERVDLDAPVVWAGRNIRKDTPSMRKVWAWKNQLDAGVPADELAAKEKTNTRFISTHVKMLEEHLSANNAPSSKGVEMEDKKEEAAAPARPAPRSMNDWQPLASLSRQPKAPSLNSLHRRAQSTHPQWAHYESEDADKVDEDFDLRTKTVYRITPGYTFKELTDKEQLSWGASTTEEPKEMLHIPPNAPLPKKTGEVVSLEVSLGDKETRIAELQRALKKQRQEITEAEELLEQKQERIVDLETCYNLARETRETWVQRAAAAEATLASIQEALEPIGDFAGKDTPIDQRIAQLVERSFREHANLYAMQQAALEFMEKYDVSDDGWWDADLVDYVNAACQGIENHYDRQLKELTEAAAKLPSVRSELERVSENLLAVHRECERRGYGSDDKRPAVEKVREIIGAFEQLELKNGQLVQNADAQVHNIALLEERTEELGRKLARVQSDASKAGFLNEVLEAADEGNPWPALYRAAREVMR